MPVKEPLQDQDSSMFYWVWWIPWKKIVTSNKLLVLNLYQYYQVGVKIFKYVTVPNKYLI